MARRGSTERYQRVAEYYGYGKVYGNNSRELEIRSDLITIQLPELTYPMRHSLDLHHFTQRHAKLHLNCFLYF